MKNILSRRSIRKYDASFKIPREEMIKIIEDTKRAPSSQNMQPVRFFVIESDAAKEKLRPILFGNQMQLETSSAMICLFADLRKFDFAEKIYQKAVDAGYMPKEVKDRQLQHFNEVNPYANQEKNKFTITLDGGITANQLMLVAKNYGYDTCAIGGFNKELINDALNIDANRYMPLVIIAIGKAAESGYQSVRLDQKDTTFFL